MKTFKLQLKKSLENQSFKEMYEEERELLDVAMHLQEARRKAGMSQKELADAAHLTQQQVSKVENGMNCNIMTYLKACHAIGLKLKLSPTSRAQKLLGAH